MMTLPRRASGVVGLLGLLWLSPAGLADFKIQAVDAQRVADRLIVNASLELALTEETARAVNQGVPLVFLTEFAVIDRQWLWERRRVRYRTRSRLRYHTLSDYYIVDVAGSEDIETFRTLSDALEHIGTIEGLVLDWPSFARGVARTGEIDVRSRLDIDALPAPLRPTAYLSGDWQLGGDWTRWRLKR